LFGTSTPFISKTLIYATGDKAAPAFWLMIAAAASIVAALIVYRGGEKRGRATA
jgi:MHS family citrate/tricarballylate:H+ symporter-like MFS transporter